MNYKLLSLFGAVLLGSGLAMAQDYEDDIYYDGEKDEVKTTKVVTRKAPATNLYASAATLSTQVTPLEGVVNGRDVDEYNRRYEGIEEEDTTYLSDDAFANTRRIERFHNPDVVIRSNDPDLIEYYFDSTPTVNLIVGTDWSWGPYWGWTSRYYDPWYSSWGWYSPWRYSWYDWNWYGIYRPWYAHWGWGSPWYSGWGWSRPYWGGYYGGHHRGWYGDRGHGLYNHGYNGRRPGRNYYGNRGNVGHAGGYAGAPRNNNRYGASTMNRGNIGRSGVQAGNRSYNGGGYAGRSASRPNSTYNGSRPATSSGRSYSAPSSSGRSYSAPSSSGRSYSAPSSGGRSSGGFSGGSHGGGGGYSGGSHGGGSHGGGGGHGGRR